MKTKYSKVTFLFPSLMAVVMITGLVHASALESADSNDVYLRPTISPNFTKEELDMLYLASESTLENTAMITGKEDEPEDEVSTNTPSSDQSRFLSFFTKLFSSSTDGLNEEEKKNLFAQVMIKLGIDPLYVVPTSNTSLPTMISNINVQVSSSSVTFMWELNKFADVTIYYTTSEKVIATSTTPNSKVSAFRFTSETTLENLEADTTYNYVLLVDNHFSKETTTSTGSFRTAPN